MESLCVRIQKLLCHSSRGKPSILRVQYFLYALIIILWTSTVGTATGAKYLNLAREVRCGRVQLTSDGTRRVRAINSSVSYRGEFPWMVSFRWSNHGGHFCGGSLIHRRYILSAAHCFRKFTDAASAYPLRWMEVTIGENRLVEGAETKNNNMAVEEILVHPEFNASDFTNDIAIIKLAEDVRWNVFKQPVCLPSASGNDSGNSDDHSHDEDDDDDDLTGSTSDTNNSFKADSSEHSRDNSIQLAGWGSTLDSKNAKASDVLRKTSIFPIYKRKDCQRMYATSSFHVTDKHLCAGGGPGDSTIDKNSSDACYGDSGGPLMMRRNYEDGNGDVTVVIGVVSGSLGCAKYPGIYSRVTKYVDWIRHSIQDEDEKLNEIRRC